MKKVTALSRLERVELRNIWMNEAEYFTPWLASEENIKLLGDTIGIDLEVESQEKNVGPFRADILCKDTANDNWVLIENQLEKTDHIHLGQIITYAAGLKAVTIIWIARQFTEEHRAAIDWLNEITDIGFNFFGIEIELWKIEDSPIAPKFNIVSQPNEWSKNVAESKQTVLTESKLLQKEYWTVFNQFVKENSRIIKPTKGLPQNWMNISIGKSGVKLNAIASFYDSIEETYDKHEIRAELVLDDQDSKFNYEKLQTQKEVIEQEIGESLYWHNPPDKRVCRIFLRESVDLNDRANWPVQHQWLLDKLELLYSTFHDRILNLS